MLNTLLMAAILSVISMSAGCGDAGPCDGFFQNCNNGDSVPSRIDADTEDEEDRGTEAPETQDIDNDTCPSDVCLVADSRPVASFMASSVVMGAGSYRVYGQFSPALVSLGRSTSPEGFEVLAGTPAMTSALDLGAPISASCGDGIAQLTNGELCDGDDLGPATTCDLLGFIGDTSTGLTCNAACGYDTTNCRDALSYCGNGVVDTSKGEDCDPPGASLVTDACTRLGFDMRDQTANLCRSDCKWDLSLCAFNRNTGVSAGLTHTCALAQDESGTTVGVECWGDNRARGLEDFPGIALQEVLVGDGFHCGRAVADGSLVCWGSSVADLVPNPDTSGCSPTDTTRPCPSPLKKLRVTADGFCGLRDSTGSLLSCGNMQGNDINTSGMPDPTDFDLSPTMLCEANISTSVRCTRRGPFAQDYVTVLDMWDPTTDKLFVGDNSICTLQPPQFGCWSVDFIDASFNVTTMPTTVTHADMFGDKICAFDASAISASDSGIRCWAANQIIDTSNTPADPIGFDLTSGTGLVTNLTMGDGFLCLDTIDGVRCAEMTNIAGYNIPTASRFGQQIPPYVPVKSVALSHLGDRSCALKDLGTGFTRPLCWGPDAPTDGLSDANWSQVSLSDTDLCFLSDDGGVKCASQDVAIPGSFDEWDAPVGVLLKQISVSLGVACGVSLTDNTLHCWDKDGVTPQFFDALPTGETFEMVETFLGGGWCGIKDDGFLPGVGTLRCSPSVAQAIGIPERSSAPTYRDVSLTEGYGCAVRGNGWVDCWGSRPGEPQNNPSKPAVAVDVSYSHACALLIDGTLDCWGDLPGGLDVTSSRAQALTGVEVGFAGVCATRRNNELVCWGSDHSLGHR